MLKTLQNAFKIKDIRKKLFYTFLMLVVVRIGSQLPIPGVNSSILQDFLADDAFNFFNAVTGGSFTQMSIFALSIAPYITSSIIMQLLTIAIPKLEEMQKDGEDGRKKIAEITRYVTVALSLIESTAMAIGFGDSYYKDPGIFSIIVAILTMTAGSAFLMWIGEQITAKGVGNGISIVLTINILSRLPKDFATLFERFMSGKAWAPATLAAAIIIAVVVMIVAFVVFLQGGQRKIAVQYAKKMQGRKMVGGQSSHIPLKVNTAGVIPIIFAQSLMQFPVILTKFFNIDESSVWQKIMHGLSSSYWFKVEEPIYSVGLLFYILLTIFFAYFYTSITFNPIEVANNIKKQGGFIPGIRPGKPTTEYLTRILNYIVFIGAAGLVIIAIIPIILSGVFNVNVSFGGTSLIIIVGVILDTMKKIESMMLVRNYKGFLTD